MDERESDAENIVSEKSFPGVLVFGIDMRREKKTGK
jgi:hypothetical protein